MPGYEHERERAWDEYDWERFLQQQDHKTEKYMELLEKYLDHPQRDQIIAREMGWTQLVNSDDWSDEVDALLGDESSESEDASAEEGTATAASMTRCARATKRLWYRLMQRTRPRSRSFAPKC